MLFAHGGCPSSQTHLASGSGRHFGKGMSGEAAGLPEACVLKCLKGLIIALLLLVAVGCAARTKVVKADWQNPNHKMVGQQLAALLHAAGRDPSHCTMGIVESEKINAFSAGGCRFGFTDGLAATGDVQLIRGVAAHEIAHEVLGHADKRKAAIATQKAILQGVSFIPGIGGLIAVGTVLVAGMVVLPAYSRSQEADADSKAVEILRSADEQDSAGTMAHSFRVLLAHAGATGGGLLDSHPGTPERLEKMLALQRAQPPPSALPTASIFQAEKTDPGAPQPSQSPSTPEPARGAVAAMGGGPEKSTVAPPIKTSADAPPGRAIDLVELPPGTPIRDLGLGNQAAIVLVYQSGSKYCERVEGYLRQLSHRFSDRAAFFRVEVSAADPGLAGPEPRTTPILAVVRQGKERDRIAGIPARIPGKTPEEGLSDWLTDRLDRPAESPE